MQEQEVRDCMELFRELMKQTRIFACSDRKGAPDSVAIYTRFDALQILT